MHLKKKIINDPVYGFISIYSDLLYQLIEHPYFQRLSRIKQLGLTYLVYPGANHTRFHHALGAMHLMQRAISVLRSKGVEITEEEEIAAQAAILLHDVGHGPFSHVMEHSFILGVSHEQISIAFMEGLNREFRGQLQVAIDIFKGNYPKKFLHQLISGQLDVDRLDYLTRDSFYTGVQEGIVGLERIIEMLNVQDDKLVVDEKGLYSIEKFLIARRLMYWQVYLHKTVIAADSLLLNILKRVKYLNTNGQAQYATSALSWFVQEDIQWDVIKDNADWLNRFASLDDTDVITSVKAWQASEDLILSEMSKALINRKLPKISIRQEAYSLPEIDEATKEVAEAYDLSLTDATYLVDAGELKNTAYMSNNDEILIKTKLGQLLSLSEVSQNYNFVTPKVLTSKFYICRPKKSTFAPNNNK